MNAAEKRFTNRSSQKRVKKEVVETRKTKVKSDE